MIVLSRKRILTVILCLCISMFTFLFMTQNKNETVETVSLPVTGKVVVLDAGHGIPDERCAK